MSDSRPTPLWTPSEQAVTTSRLTDYMAWLEQTRGLRFGGYDELWAWSVADLDGFWGSIWDYFEVGPRSGPVLGSRAMPGATWFPDTVVSYAEHVFRGRRDDETAILHRSELRPPGEVSWGELRHQTARIAACLRRCGVARGDRVVAYMPNIPEAVAAFLACSSLGAVWSTCSPDFGAGASLDRFAQIEPKVMLAVDGYRYGGKDFDRRDVVEDLRLRIPSLERVFVLPYLGDDGNWSELLGPEEEELAFERVPFGHPLWVLYSSGTTGLPKPIVHSQGGILLEHLKTLHLHFDLRPSDRFFWFTTTGWMMWNLLVSGLLTDAAIVCFDGSPGSDGMSTLWDLAAHTGITCFGTSAAYINACMKANVEPAEGRDLSRLRGVGSTGSPLSPEGFRWVYEHVGADTWLFSTSGGTDVCTAFVGGVPTLPVYQGELQAPSLGAALEAWDEQGNAVVGQVGELVLTAPMPSMPIRFWGDADGSRYHESYFATYPGIWRHGDWIELTDRRTAIIYGRSDSTINRGGIRIGTSEIYRAVLSLPELTDALVVDVPCEGTDGWIALFVVLRDDAVLDEHLSTVVKQRIRDYCSSRHVPNEIIAVGAIPRTLSGKILEIPVKRILAGADLRTVANPDTLANPEALAAFAEIRCGSTALRQRCDNRTR